MTKVLLCGDSFAVNYRRPEEPGWVNMLEKHYELDNRAQAGVGEYKILQQLLKIETIAKYDRCIVFHTSPNRVHIDSIPFHENLHQHSDLIFQDVMYHYGKNPNDQTLKAAKLYFEQIFDETYYQDVYQLIFDKIVNLCIIPTLHVFSLYMPAHSGLDYINLQKLITIQPGKTNHMSYDDNQFVAKSIQDWLK